MLTSSVDLLKRLKVWETIEPHAAPLKAIHISDASRSLLRSPDIAFEARELGLDAFETALGVRPLLVRSGGTLRGSPFRRRQSCLRSTTATSPSLPMPGLFYGN